LDSGYLHEFLRKKLIYVKMVTKLGHLTVLSLMRNSLRNNDVNFISHQQSGELVAVSMIAFIHSATLLAHIPLK
jgi:hypothetical protein